MKRRMVQVLKSTRVLQGFFVISLTACGCDHLVHYRFDGTVVERETGKPLGKREVHSSLYRPSTILPSEPDEESYSRALPSMQIMTTDEQGHFQTNFSEINGPTKPRYILTMEGSCPRTWLVDFNHFTPKILRWDPSKAVFIQTSDKEELSANIYDPACSFLSFGCNDPITSEVKIRWTDNSCSDEDVGHSHIYNAPWKLPRNEITADFSAVFSKSLGISLSRNFQNNSLAIEMTTGFRGSSWGLGLLGEIRLPLLKYLHLNLGLGPQWLHTEESDSLAGALSSPLNSVFALLQAGISLSFKNGLIAKAGYGHTIIGQNQFDERMYVKAVYSI